MVANLSRRSVLGGLGALTVGGLIGCGPGRGSNPDTVTYQLSWLHSVQFGGTYIALHEKLFEELGLTVQLASGGPNVAGDANTVSGVSLMNISVADNIARSNAEGADLVIIGAQYQKSPPTILSLADAPIVRPQDMIGKRIGVASANVPMLTAFLRINAIEEGRVEFVPSQYDPAILTAGQVDGLYCFYNDLPVSLAVQGIEGHSMLLADFGYDPMSQTYAVLRSSLEDATKRDQIVRLIKGDARGWQRYRDDPAAAAELTVQMYPDAGLDLETQKKQAEVQLDIMFSKNTDEHGFAWFTDEQIQQNLKLFDVLGVTGGTEKMWDRSILEQVYDDGPLA